MMPELQDRLSGVFSTVFPGLSASEIAAASTATVASWDSIAALNLLTLLEEEFGVSIPPSELPQLRSFAAIESYLRAKGVAS
jgi:acyl carrier protein